LGQKCEQDPVKEPPGIGHTKIYFPLGTQFLFELKQDRLWGKQVLQYIRDYDYVKPTPVGDRLTFDITLSILYLGPHQAGFGPFLDIDPV
jgi:hypothetical protein